MMTETRRALLSAVQRGICGRCPACGRGPVLRGYIAPVSACDACGEDLSPYRTADVAPYLVTFVIGLIFTPLVLVLSLSGAAEDWMIVPLLATALGLAIFLLPRAKGAVIGVLWALDVRA